MEARQLLVREGLASGLSHDAAEQHAIEMLELSGSDSHGWERQWAGLEVAWSGQERLDAAQPAADIQRLVESGAIPDEWVAPLSRRAAKFVKLLAERRGAAEARRRQWREATPEGRKALAANIIQCRSRGWKAREHFAWLLRERARLIREEARRQAKKARREAEGAAREQLKSIAARWAETHETEDLRAVEALLSKAAKLQVRTSAVKELVDAERRRRDSLRQHGAAVRLQASLRRLQGAQRARGHRRRRIEATLAAEAAEADARLALEAKRRAAQAAAAKEAAAALLDQEEREREAMRARLAAERARARAKREAEERERAAEEERARLAREDKTRARAELKARREAEERSRREALASAARRAAAEQARRMAAVGSGTPRWASGMRAVKAAEQAARREMEDVAREARAMAEAAREESRQQDLWRTRVERALVIEAEREDKADMLRDASHAADRRESEREAERRALLTGAEAQVRMGERLAAEREVKAHQERETRMAALRKQFALVSPGSRCHSADRTERSKAPATLGSVAAKLAEARGRDERINSPAWSVVGGAAAG